MIYRPVFNFEKKNFNIVNKRDTRVNDLFFTSRNMNQKLVFLTKKESIYKNENLK